MSYFVLVTDDNAANRKLIIQILRGSIDNIIFFEADNGEECLKIMRQHTIDLNILDLLMPTMDGFEVIRCMKSDGRLCDIPIIINSAVEDIPSIRQILLEGANDYFSKPLMPEEIRTFLPLKVKNALIRYEQQKKIKDINERNQKELQMASSLQSSIMAGYKRFQKAEMFGEYLPSHEIGGDFYDCLEREGKLWFLIADVSGQGIAAAMVSIMLKGMFGNMIPRKADPGLFLERLNQKFAGIFGQINPYLISAFAGCIEGNVFAYSNAGHPYPILANPDANATTVLDQNGFLLGTMERADYRTYRIGLQKGDWIITYTDGLFGREYGGRETKFSSLLQNIGRQMKESRGSPARLIRNAMPKAGDSTDDASMMIIRSL